MNKKCWGICLKWGIALGALLTLLEIIKMFARHTQYGNTQMFDLCMVILYILLLYRGGKQFKEHYDGRLSFGKAFLCGTLISFAGSAILFIYTLFHYSVIEKDGLEKKYASALYNFKQNILNDTITSTELTHYIDTVKLTMLAQKVDICPQDSTDTTLYDKIHRGIILVENYYRQKMNFRPEIDTALHYQLRNFTNYSRKTLMNTLIAYIAQNDREPSTPYVRSIVENTNKEMVNFDPGEKRYQQLKHKVPHYDKTGTFASVNAVMELLYGMFFSIFTSMYLYRSKHPLEEPQESQSPEQASAMKPENDVTKDDHYTDNFHLDENTRRE